MHTTTLLSAFVLAAVAITGTQAQCSIDVYNQCVSDNGIFERSTCQSTAVQQSPDYNNVTMVAVCECYRYANLGNCYTQCANDATITAQYNSVILPNITSACTAAKLNPKALPQPAPWVKTTTTTSATATATASTATASPTAASTTQGKSAGANVKVAVGILGAVVAGVVGVGLGV
ncbi:hypothetical protein HDV00_005186 [Rhizophlyctis rosea]|nr:hypothetical protein HDV00_005186 [Rhizophlyctis rosea]